MDLPFPPLVPAAPHTQHSSGGARAGGAHRRGPGSCCFSVALAAALVPLGLLSYMAGAFSGVYIILQEKVLKGRHRNPISSWEEGTYTEMEIAERCWPGEGKEEGPQPEGGAQSWVTVSTCDRKKKGPTSLTSSRKGALKSKQKLVIVLLFL